MARVFQERGLFHASRVTSHAGVITPYQLFFMTKKTLDSVRTAEQPTSSSGASEGQAVARTVTQTASAVAATASHEAKRKPIQVFREGDNVSASVWTRQ